MCRDNVKTHKTTAKAYQQHDGIVLSAHCVQRYTISFATVAFFPHATFLIFKIHLPTKKNNHHKFVYSKDRIITTSSHNELLDITAPNEKIIG